MLKMRAKKRAVMHMPKIDTEFESAKEERLHNYRVYCQKRSEYERSVRHHEKNNDPALPSVDERGVALIPSLASQDAASESRRPLYGRGVALPAADINMMRLPLSLARRTNKSALKPQTPDASQASNPRHKYKHVRFDEGPRKYITPRSIDGELCHYLKALDKDPHPSRETSRHKGGRCNKLLCRKSWTYERGRYADQDGVYWQTMVASKDKTEKHGPENKGKGPVVSTAFLPGLGMFSKQDARQVQSCWEFITRVDPVCGEKTPSKDDDQFEDAEQSTPQSACPLFPQPQGDSTHYAPSGGEKLPLVDDYYGEQLKETDECDISVNAQESFCFSARARPFLPQLQETFAYFDPFGGDPLNDDADDFDERFKASDQCGDVFEDAQESMSSPASPRDYPQQQQETFAHYDPIGRDAFDDEDEEDEDDVHERAQDTNQCDASQSAQGSISYSAHSMYCPRLQQPYIVARFEPFDSSVPDHDWMMPESEK